MSETIYLSDRRAADGGRKTVMISVLRRASRAARRRLQSWRDRRLLRALPEDRLWDIGLTSEDVLRLTAGPFWRPVDYDWLEARRRSNSLRPARPR